MQFAPLSPAPHTGDEFELLCDLLAGRSRSPGVSAALGVPGRAAAVLDLAEEERVLAALHEAVATRSCSELLPKADRAVLAIRHEANRRHNVALRQALRELGEAGASAGIAFAVLKGAAWLIEDDAGCAAWRQMIDLDVLVHPEQFDVMPDLLRDMGYSPASEAKRFRDNFHHAPYRHPRLAGTLEVHRHIGWRHHLLPCEALLADSRPVAPGLLLPSPWVRAFHAIIHWQIQDHGGSRGTLPLKDVVDVARFLHRNDVAWATLSVMPNVCRPSRLVGSRSREPAPSLTRQRRTNLLLMQRRADGCLDPLPAERHPRGRGLRPRSGVPERCGAAKRSAIVAPFGGSSRP
jgi:hypothetical protein